MPDPGDSRRTRSGSSAETSWLTLDTIDETNGWRGVRGADTLVAAAGAGLAAHQRFASSGPAKACVALSDDAAVKGLNAQFRGIDKPTNVLSFPPLETPYAREAIVRNLGDIILARETVLREAAEQDIAPAHHLQHLVVHGLLHLLGFDHETHEDADEMEDLEVEILAALGIANPYADPPSKVATLAAASRRMNAAVK